MDNDTTQNTNINDQKKKKIIIGLPGNSFSYNFLLSWTQTLYNLWDSQKYDVVIAPGVSSFVTFARMKTLGLDVLRGKEQKPFNNMDYDIFITIDSDIIFNSSLLIKLIESTEIHPVVAGYYMMSDTKSLAIVKDWNTDFFTKNGTFQFLKLEDIKTWKEETGSNFMPVSYVGMGFMAITKEALNKLEYPYFNSDLQVIQRENNTDLVDMCSEDVSFCKNLQKAGFTVYVNTDIRVGHEKSLIL